MPAPKTSQAEWRLKARTGAEPVEAPLIQKAFDVAVASAANDDAAARRISFVISTSAPDRDNDSISISGMRLESYLRNPVVMWAHDYRIPPIGRAVSIAPDGEVLRAVAEFDSDPLAETVLGKLQRGYLKACSVGFRPLKYAWNEERGGIDYLESELLEFSVCPIGMNAEALADARAAGIDASPLVAWAEQVLDANEPGGTWLPRAEVARAFRGIGEQQIRARALDGVIAILKAGRVLSAANEAKLRGARDNADALCAALDEVLAQVEDDSKSVSEPFLRLRPEPTFRLPDGMTRADLVGSMSKAMKAAADALRCDLTGRLPD